LDFLSALDTNTNVTSLITGSDDGLESGSLTSLGLLLDGQDAHDLIEQFSVVFLVGNELLDNLCLLDWDGVGVDFLERFDVAGFDQSSELGKWSPVVFATESATWTTSSTSTSTATSAASITEASSAASATSTSTSGIFTASWGGALCWGCCCWCFHA